jgi:hypothetical protein
MLGLGIASFVEGGSVSKQMPASFTNTKSMRFDGTNDYVDTNYAANTLFRDSFSFSFWMRPADGQPSATQATLGVETGSNADVVHVTLNTNGTLGFSHASNSSLNYTVTDAAVFTNGVQSDFKHIVITEEKVSSGNAAAKIYVNGVDTAFSVLGGGFFVINQTNFEAFDHGGLELNIGACNDDGTQDLFYDGMLDEVAIFDKKLSSSEVTGIYNSGTPKDESSHDGLLMYYRFEDDVNDTAGTSNGTNNGASFNVSVPS